jgi:hypothetical protein
MPTHTVSQGDCLSSLASQQGLKWETVWNHPNNQALKQQRKDPNVLYPGDEIYLPDRETKELPRPTEKRHKFAKSGIKAKIKLRLLDDYKPRAGVNYELEIDGVRKTGVTDGNGFLEQSIPPGARRGRLLVGKGTTKDVYELLLGELDPIDTEAGLRGRLTNLGFGADDLSEAISAFQQKEGLEISGEANELTANRLKERFGQ